MKVLVTGASGFVGRALVAEALTRGWSVRAAVRGQSQSAEGCDTCHVGEIGPDTDWSAALRECDAVIHLAARVHVMREVARDPVAEFQRINTLGTSALAMQAAQAGVRRFVFASSVKVNGEERARPYTEGDAAHPLSPYGVSKRDAEESLREISQRTGLEVAIVRPPLVYGPGVGGNFVEMMRWLHKGVPLPLGAIENRRSLVARDNLVDLLLTCARHRDAANQTFLVSDGEDLSTTQLLRKVAAALGQPARLWPVPVWFLQGAATLIGQRAMAQRLCGSLQVRIDKVRTVLGWRPPLGVDEALRRTARDFLEHSS